MNSQHAVKIFTDKFPLIGPLVWVFSAQYFAAQFIAAAAWPVSYNWAVNRISDLGATICGAYNNRFVCSPDHALMNASFILLGIIMALGSLLIYQEFRESKLSLLGFSMMALAGLGAILVGVVPENTVNQLHTLGAFLALGVGNAALIILAIALKRVHKIFRVYTFITGIFTLTFLITSIFNLPIGLGQGTIERLVSYPQTAWLILFGLYMSGSHIRRSQHYPSYSPTTHNDRHKKQKLKS